MQKEAFWEKLLIYRFWWGAACDLPKLLKLSTYHQTARLMIHLSVLSAEQARLRWVTSSAEKGAGRSEVVPSPFWGDFLVELGEGREDRRPHQKEKDKEKQKNITKQNAHTTQFQVQS